MSVGKRILDHLERISRHFGKGIPLGRRVYRSPGYISNVIAVANEWESDVTVVLRRLLADTGTFIDVGVNLGQTLGKVLEIDQNRRYIGFEPQIGACFFVNKFINDNSLSTFQVLPVGLSSTGGLKQFWSEGDADVMGSFYRDGRKTAKNLVVTRRGDDILDELQIEKISGIKVDVEGAELDVLNGLRQTLLRHRPPVIFEVLPNFEGEHKVPIPNLLAQQRNNEAINLMKFWDELDYLVFAIDSFGNEIFLEEFDLDDPSVFRGTNFVARPRQNSPRGD